MTQFGIHPGSKDARRSMAGGDLLAGDAVRARETCMR
jgi:hypothetical protein